MGYENTAYLEPGEDVEDKWDWLMSSQRDGVFGDANHTNKRTLVFTPGVHTTDNNSIMPYHHIELVAMNGAYITSTDPNRPALTITGRDIHLKNLYIENTACTAGQLHYDYDVNGMSLYIANSGFYEGATISSDEVTVDSDNWTDGLVDNPIDPCWTDHNDPRPFVGKWDCILVNDKDGDVTPGWYAVRSVVDTNTVQVWDSPGNSAGDVYMSVCCQHVLVEGCTLLSEIYDVNGGTTVQSSGYGGHGGGIWRNNITGVGGIRARNPHPSYTDNPHALRNIPIDNGSDANDLGSDLVGIDVTSDHNVPWGAVVKINATTSYDGWWPVVAVDSCSIHLPALYVETETFGVDDELFRIYLPWLICRIENNRVGHFSIGGDKCTLSGYIENNQCGDSCINSCTSFGTPIRYATIKNNYCRNKAIGLDTWIMNSEIIGNVCGYSSIGGKANTSSDNHAKIWNSEIRNNKVTYNSSYDSYGIKANVAYYGKSSYYINKGDLNLSVLKDNWYGDASDRSSGEHYSGEILYFENNVIEGMVPEASISKTSATTIYGFDSGGVFDNDGASGSVTFTLSSAALLPGNFCCTFRDVNNTATVDVIVDCDGGDKFQYGATPMAAGESYQHTSDSELGAITVKVASPNNFLIEDVMGTWAEETP